MSNQNITLSLPEEVLGEIRVMAARRRTSISRLLTDVLREMVDRETGYALARDHSLRLLDDGFFLGTQARPGWNRDELHDR